eukprot:CAMPEP_0172201690 /NCGR_PEP_ID=MMETSP1050-20130122/30170_1 /TAXON_ID=233186 /ORGANISM="Cryptomonas curvata, Strain CCAP979/52" /LENGTH=174 /DNA_ID=CAMNT_0012879425 /DNA_START=187 /DNA_END=707 /DNA_ORIENTATION=+
MTCDPRRSNEDSRRRPTSSLSPSPAAWILLRRAALSLRGAGIATFVSTGVVTYLAQEQATAACANVQEAARDAADAELLTLPRVMGHPVSIAAPFATLAAVSSNSSYEDRSFVHITSAPGGEPELYFGVLDGHGGSECAEFAYPLLSVAATQMLADQGPGPHSAEAMEEAIVKG